MNQRVLGVAAAVSFLMACGGGGGGGGGGGTTLTVTSSAAAIKADGQATTSITVSGTLTYPVVLRTNMGLFPASGTQTYSFATGPAPLTATLKACDSRTESGCGGLAIVTVTDAALASGRVQVTFRPVELCNNLIDDDGNGLADCADTAACPNGSACGANGKVCASGACACPGGTAEVCSDGVDNNCDGKIDCADTQCQPHGSVPGAKCDTGTLGVGGAHVFGACTGTGTCSCTGSGKETSCGDGIDNNCNGLIDCDDPDCQPVGNAVGGSCDTRGNTCSPLAAGKSTCSRCAPGGDPKKYQPIETSCGDAVDNDCNGVADCQDANCAAQGFSCSATGQVCTAQLTCQCPDTSGVELNCGDGADNDCNGFIDCKDVSCHTKPCGLNGKFCSTTSNGNGSCACPATPGSDGTTEVCNDGIDNNCDGLIDCADPTCRASTAGGSDGKVCRTAALVSGGRCDYFGQCVCPGGQAREATCDDGQDNDCNGYADCQDLACNGQTCKVSGQSNGRVCVTTANGSGTCACPATPGSDGTTEVCNDGKDNNCDGRIDCADTACQGATPSTPGQACNPADASYKCTNIGGGTPSWVCQTTARFTLTVSASPARIPADGAAQSTVTAVLRDTSGSAAGVPVAGATVTFSAAPLGAVTASAVTDATGTATATFRSTSLTSAGATTVTAAYAGPPSTSAPATITLPQLSSMSLVSQQYPVMGARGSGYQEQNTLTFRLLDSTNTPYPAGLTVSFEHQPLQGSYIGTTPTCTPAVNPTLCTATGTTDGNGNASVLLHSGQTAGVVSVTAKAQAGSLSSVQLAATNIAIVGAKASGAEIAVSCTPRNIPALLLGQQDCTNSSYAGADARTTCTVTLADRYKNALGVATVATFETEAGIAGPPATTPPYDTSKPPLQQSNLGVAQDYVSVTNAKLPADVTPFLGEYAYAYDAGDGCGVLTHNPRDGLVTVIVKVRGEEGFVDGTNGCPRDGTYNAPGSVAGCSGEYFIDIGEPFVDYNDNGTWNSGEPYDDINGNGRWDGPNGTWDADTTIWAQTRILYTDYVAVIAAGGLNGGSRFYGATLPPTPTAPVGFAVLAQQAGPPPIPATAQTIPLYFSDKNFNLPNSKYTYSSSKSGGTFTVGYPIGGEPTTLDGLGMNLVQRYCTTPTPTNPATQCSGTCASAPCYAVVDISGFQYGAFGALTVTGGSAPDPGVVCGFATGTLTTTNTVSNTTTTVNTSIGVCGTSR
jgi:hypothetical protein